MQERQAVKRTSPAVTAAGLAVGIVAISCSPVLVRLAGIPALSLAFWRCLLGALVLAPFALRGPLTLPSGERRRLVLAGILLAGHFSLWNASLALTTVASSTLLVSMSPLFVGLGAARFLGEPPTRRAWAGILLATAGAGVVAAGDLGTPDLGQRALAGDAMAFAGALLFAGYLLVGRAARQRLALTTYAGGLYAVAALALLPACLATGSSLAGYKARSWLALAAVVLGPQLGGHTVFNGLLATVRADVVSVATLMEPVGATVLAWLLFAELPPAWFWLGAPAVLAGVWMSATGSRWSTVG